jgi:hypothetical protein
MNPLGRYMCRFEDNIKMNLRESELGLVRNFGLHKNRDLLDEFSNYHIFNEFNELIGQSVRRMSYEL